MNFNITKAYFNWLRRFILVPISRFLTKTNFQKWGRGVQIVILYKIAWKIIYDFKVLEKSLIGSVLAFFVDDSNFENIINLQIYISHAPLIFLVETLRLRTYLTIFRIIFLLKSAKIDGDWKILSRSS